MQVPAPIEYARATSLDHALGLLERLGGEARVIAGGHSLLPMMKLRLANPEYLVDLNDLHDELGYIRDEPGNGGGVVRIGALTRHRELLESDLLAALFPIFRDAESVIADPPVRNRGTLGGSLCQADPSEDLSSVCTVLGASCVVRGRSGRRVVTMEEFYRGPYETAVGPAEILTEIRIPVRPGGGSAYAKVHRRAGDWAVVAAGAAVWLTGPPEEPVIVDARSGLAAVGPNTTGIAEISATLTGRPPDEEAFALAAEIAARSCAPVTDARGSADYKRHLAAELTRRTLRTATERARLAAAADRPGASGDRG
ncbi:xanthine dehydrogenase family protein subunit M [Nocardioides sp. KR10-350]|uniref:FAD binding domain-containing protein n=1 Tax=Nocardioides cheoyonin TaxID=3156615 RepID=UPI0032B4B4E5